MRRKLSAFLSSHLWLLALFAVLLVELTLLLFITDVIPRLPDILR